MARRKSSTVTVGDVAQVLDRIAPPSLAQSWDNVGLLIGDRAHRCHGLLLTIDLTLPVLREAVHLDCDLIVSYHPPLFQPLKRILADARDTGPIVHGAIAADIAVYSPHTALDATPGGTNDVLAGLCGLIDVQPFEYVHATRQELKIVTFVPPQQVNVVASAMSAAGAGRIGDYEQCSFRSAGAGTFFGTPSTNPRVGRKGRLEQVDEIRLEMVAPTALLPEITTALRRTHPYEEPAFDIYPLTAEPVLGIGRVGQLPAGVTLANLARRLKKATGSKVTTLIGNPAARVTHAAVCVGAAGRLPLEKPRSANCDVIVTGEIRHHDALTMQRNGLCAVALGHWESERPALKPLSASIKKELPSLRVSLSRNDVPPFNPGF